MPENFEKHTENAPTLIIEIDGGAIQYMATDLEAINVVLFDHDVSQDADTITPDLTGATIDDLDDIASRIHIDLAIAEGEEDGTTVVETPLLQLDNLQFTPVNRQKMDYREALADLYAWITVYGDYDDEQHMKEVFAKQGIYNDDALIQVGKMRAEVLDHQFDGDGYDFDDEDVQGPEKPSMYGSMWKMSGPSTVIKNWVSSDTASAAELALTDFAHEMIHTCLMATEGHDADDDGGWCTSYESWDDILGSAQKALKKAGLPDRTEALRTELKEERGESYGWDDDDDDQDAYGDDTPDFDDYNPSGF